MTAGTHPPAAPDGLGFVSLVGAGPGDPELLTLKAARRLAEADLLLYDGLVPTEITALATRAQHFCVSKRAGRPAVDQETIQQVMIRGARRGKRVVRLKNGDPSSWAGGGGGSGPARGGHPVRGRPRHYGGDCGARSGGHPGDAPGGSPRAHRRVGARGPRRSGRS